MSGRERVRAIVARRPADRCGFWLGEPHAETWPILHRHFGTTAEEELRQKLHDDLRWFRPHDAYRHPEGKPMFDVQQKARYLGAPGIFAECDSVAMVDAFAWPDPDYLDFTGILDALDRVGDVYRAASFLSPFFHEVADFFGMDSYFTRMYTNPEVVHAVTRHVVDFYREANRRLFAQAGDRIDGCFYFNDFGTQKTTMVSLDLLRTFILPYLAELVADARACGYQVLLHSCGAVADVVPDLIAMGMDGLHPLQARAEGMDAETLADRFQGRIAFLGGIDTQELLVHGTPDEVTREVRRVKAVLGPSLVIGPSHEAILPNIPPANVEAMARAAVEP